MSKSRVNASSFELYSPAVRYHLNHMERGGRFPRGDRKKISQGIAGGLAAGAFVRIYCQSQDNGTFEARFEVFGGPFLIASASWYCAEVSGRRLEDPIPTGLDAARALCLPRSQHGNCLLVEDALRDALKGLL